MMVMKIKDDGYIHKDNKKVRMPYLTDEDTKILKHGLDENQTYKVGIYDDFYGTFTGLDHNYILYEYNIDKPEQTGRTSDGGTITIPGWSEQEKMEFSFSEFHQILDEATKINETIKNFVPWCGTN